MSHGNLNNNSSGGIVDRLNGFLARLMGKKNNLPNNNPKQGRMSGSELVERKNY